MIQTASQLSHAGTDVAVAGKELLCHKHLPGQPGKE